MGDAAESLADMKLVQQYRRAQKRESAPEKLTAANIVFSSFNNGAHLRLSVKDKTIDFWPGTERWMVCGSGKAMYGTAALIEFCNKNKES